MTFEISIVRKIKAKREYVFDWWTDLSPNDATLVKPLKSRRIISRTPQLILLRDEEQMYFKKMAFDVKVTLEQPESWVSEYTGEDALARSEYILTQEQDGTTTLVYHTRIEPKGVLTNIFSPFVKPFVKRVFSGEMRIFIRALEDEYKAYLKQLDEKQFSKQ